MKPLVSNLGELRGMSCTQFHNLLVNVIVMCKELIMTPKKVICCFDIIPDLSSLIFALDLLDFLLFLYICNILGTFCEQITLQIAVV